MMIKLIALDMDGTLLNKQRVISERNYKAIQAAKSVGIKVVLASGRPRQGLQPYLEQLQLTGDEFVISYNGSLLQRVDSEEALHQTTLTGADIKAVFAISQQLGVYIHAFSVERGLITHQMNPYSDIESTLNGVALTEVDFSLIDDNEVFIKSMLVADESLLTDAINRVPAWLKEQYTVVRSASIFLEVLHPDSNKGIAVEKLSLLLNILPSEVMCIGDAENDHAMLSFAGVGVAMANADEKTKALSDYVTSSNIEDGVAVAIEKIALTNRLVNES